MVLNNLNEKRDFKRAFFSLDERLRMILSVPVVRYKIMKTIPKVNGITKGSKPKMILSFKTNFGNRVH